VEIEARHVAHYLKSAEVSDRLQKVGALLFVFHRTYADNEQISGLRSYKHIGRILLEQFNIIEEGKETQVDVKPSQEISAQSLQKPANDTAACWMKGGLIRDACLIWRKSARRKNKV
jgi:hypothetical protein